jgi:hypothetical protein
MPVAAARVDDLCTSSGPRNVDFEVQRNGVAE